MNSWLFCLSNCHNIILYYWNSWHQLFLLRWFFSADGGRFFEREAEFYAAAGLAAISLVTFIFTALVTILAAQFVRVGIIDSGVYEVSYFRPLQEREGDYFKTFWEAFQEKRSNCKKKKGKGREKGEKEKMKD